MVDFNEFFSQYNNKYVEKVDSTNKYQCVDLAIAWLDWLSLPRSFNHFYAKDIYLSPTQTTLKNFNKIANSPDAVPKTGDIVVWDGAYNVGIGHVGIAIGEGDIRSFKCF